MYSTKRYRWAILMAALLSFCIAAAYFTWVEAHSTMGVRILSPQQREAYTQYAYKDLSNCLVFNGKPAAVDVDSSTIYLSQDITAGTQITELSGSLAVTQRGYSLLFAPDDRFSDLAGAVQDGHRFSLLATKGADTYMEYHVVFTTLPVMRLDGSFSHKSQDERDVMLGDVCLWAPNDPALGRYSVKTSTTEWHVRGGTTAYMDKRPWKLSLKDQHLRNKDADFLGLGSDDDWILNPMVIDDTKMKENLFMQLWNIWEEEAPWNHRMSTGEYVELIVNQSYQGIYLLQRRIDEKYLKLEEEDILMKGGAYFRSQNLETAYEISKTPLSREQTFALMEGLYTGNDTSSLDLNNFLDVNLFLNFAIAADNSAHKNMYYLLQKETDGYRLSLLPWDTDMSWGVIWDDENGLFAYHYDEAMTKRVVRLEYSSVKRQVPELDTLMAQRWQAMRQSVLAEEHVLSLVDDMSTQLRRSGVLHREWDQWEPFFDGADTEQNLRKFLQERLLRLDLQFEEDLQK